MQPLVHYYEDVTVGVSVTVKGDAAEGIEQEIREFDEFAKTRLGEPLAKPEAAIVRTYIAWRLGMDKGQEQKNG